MMHGQKSAKIIVTGTVTSAVSNEPLAGINVRTGQYSSVLTDDKGEFSLRVPNTNVTLTVSNPDFQIKEVPLKGRSHVNIKIHDRDFNSYYENQDMPLGKKANSSITSAIEVKKENIATSRESVANVLNGEMAGVRAIMRSGLPGVGANIFIRGFNTLNSSTQPLIIVDGMILESNTFSNNDLISGYSYDPLSDINPKDISNITVIKDAASIYGARGANGVIIIETNKTEDVTTKIDLFVQGGYNSIPQSIPTMDSDQYKNYLADQIYSAGGSVEGLDYFIENTNFPDYEKYHNNTDWQKEIFKNSYFSEYHLKVTGGDEVAKYGLSLGYTSNEGIIRNSSYDRFTTRFNADTNINKKLSLLTNLSVSYASRELYDDGIVSETGGSSFSPIVSALQKSPFLQPFVPNADGILTSAYEDVDIIDGSSNPRAIVDNTTFASVNYNLYGQVDLAYQITDDLKIASLFGLNYIKNRQNIFLPFTGLSNNTFDFDGKLVDFERTSKVGAEEFFAFYNDTRLNYLLNINNIHDFSFNIGTRYNQNKYDFSYSISGNASDDLFTTLDAGQVETNITSGSVGSWKYASTYANVDYALLDKYFISANASADVSSRFGDSAGVGFFPSIAGAWLVSSENFMANANFVDQLKLRASYGVTGNDGIGNYNSLSYFVPTRFSIGTGLINGNIANSSITWEETLKLNLGANLGLFNERLAFSFDYFDHKTSGLLNDGNISPVFGQSSYITNNGKMTNHGFEVGINARLVNTQNFKWDIGGNISKYKNEITNISGGEQIIAINGLNSTVINREGSAVGLFYGYETDGIYNNSTEASNANLSWKDIQGISQEFQAGDVRFIDRTGDNVIDEDDRVVIGDPNPDFTGMFYNKMNYKGFELSAIFTFSKGNDVYNALRWKNESMDSYANQSAAVANRWRFENQQTTTPRAVYGDPMGNSRFSDRWIEDGSYLRLKTLSLSYTPKRFNATFYANANNLITFTKYLGYDPEFSASQLSYLQGIDTGATPQYRSVSLGVRIGL